MEFQAILLCVLIVVFCLPAWSQQTDINKYTLFTGLDSMISPARNLTERGFEADFGVTVKPWLALGADFGALGSDVISGAGTINGGETIFKPLLPPGTANLINVPFKSTIYTFAAGPQFYFRKWEKVTLFFRPGFGGIHENAEINVTHVAPLLTLIGLPVPNPKQTDTQRFFGLGSEFDVNVSPQRRNALRRGLAEHAPILESADRPAELCALLSWPPRGVGAF